MWNSSIQIGANFVFFIKCLLSCHQNNEKSEVQGFHLTNALFLRGILSRCSVFNIAALCESPPIDPQY